MYIIYIYIHVIGIVVSRFILHCYIRIHAIFGLDFRYNISLSHCDCEYSSS